MSYDAYLPPATPAQVEAVKAMVRATPATLRYDHAQLVVSLAFPALELMVVCALLWLGAAGRLGQWLMRKTGRSLFVAGLVFWVIMHAVTSAAALPMTYYSGYLLPHRFGLSTETVTAWIGDEVKGWLVDVAIGAPIAAACLVLIRRAPTTWAYRLAVALIPVIAIGIFAGPIVVDPLFNKFAPMTSANPLYSKIELLARNAGIGHPSIYIVDKSKQTNETNAYVTGLGSSSRIVIWDTLIRRTTPKQVAAVVAHEMGHYAERHVLFGLIGSAAALFLLLPLARMAALALLARWGTRWRVQRLDEPGALAVLLLTINAIAIVAMPCAAACSRYIEHRADAFGLALTGDRMDFATSMVALSSDNLSNPYPPRWVVLLMDHPPLGQRIEFALRGQPRDLWPQPAFPASTGRHTEKR